MEIKIKDRNRISIRTFFETINARIKWEESNIYLGSSRKYYDFNNDLGKNKNLRSIKIKPGAYIYEGLKELITDYLELFNPGEDSDVYAKLKKALNNFDEFTFMYEDSNGIWRVEDRNSVNVLLFLYDEGIEGILEATVEKNKEKIFCILEKDLEFTILFFEKLIEDVQIRNAVIDVFKKNKIYLKDYLKLKQQEFQKLVASDRELFKNTFIRISNFEV